MGNVYIQKRGKVYQYQFSVAPINGKRKYINKSGFKTKAEAIEEGQKAFNEYHTAGVPFKECTLSYSDYLDYWLDNYCKVNLKYNTIQAYKSLINKYIKPKIGIYKLSTITSVTLNTYINEVCNEYDYSKAYFKNILKVVKGSFRDACNIYGLIKYNPAVTLRLPKIEKEKEDIKHLYTPEEINYILNRFKDNDTFTCAFLTSCYTGMRTSEVFALTWDDINFETGIIDIKHSVYDKPKDSKGRWYIGTTKTFSGKRKINISKTLLTALFNFKKKQDYIKKISGYNYAYYHIEDVYNEYGKAVEKRIVKNNLNDSKEANINLIFTKNNGIYVGTDLIRQPFNIIHDELGIEKCRFYDLRGSYATTILKNGIEIRDVADILGHRNVETTENYYISSTKDSRKEATEVFDKIMQSDTIKEIIKYDCK
ncbi:MAG: site-specific integrase [bacterium]|nr:site-specific integrase [bacterium]